MAPAAPKSELLGRLQARVKSLGLVQRSGDADALTGESESIRAKWFLGGRKVTYRMTCRLDEPAGVVRFREVVAEKSWGVPPPTLTVEKTSTKGWARSGSRKDVSVGGGGTVDYGAVRAALEQVVTGAGWRFELEGGRSP